MTLSGLDCDEDYFFRAVAQNAAGTVFGSTRSFTTANCSSGGGETETRELIFNGDFEDGVLHWATDGDFHVGAEPNPRSGFFYAFLSNSDHFPDNELQGYIQQVVTDVPANAHSVEFSFWYSITTQESAQFSEFDTLDVELLDFGGGSIQTLETLSNLDDTGGAYQALSFDLTEFAGSSIGIKFIGETDESFPTVFRIDDVSVLAVVPEEGIPPFVVTQEADQITSSSARLNLSVDPNELETDIWFEWGEASSLNFSTDQIAVGGGSTIFDVSDSLFGLDCETTYSFRALAENSQGIDEGLPRTFTTGSCPGGPPFADTDPADSITADSARLTSEVNPNDTPTQAWFEWGTSQSLGNTTSSQSLPADNEYRDVTQTISALDCDATYYFQAVAQNTHGTDRGAIHSFATSECGGGGGPAPGGFFAWAQRQSCHGTEPALLLEWSPAANGSIYTVERLDGGYSALVDPSHGGLAHLVATGLEYGQSYDFRVLAHNESGSSSSKTVTTYIIDQDCLAAGDSNSPPGPFIPWLEPATCNSGTPAVEIHWSRAAGAESYTLVRHAASGGTGRTVTNIQDTTFLDTVDIAPGVTHAYVLEAVNAAGTTRAQLHLDFYPPPDLCSDANLPGEFVLTAGTPFCFNGEPTIPISWTTSAGADDFHRARALVQGQSTGASGFSTDNFGFNYDFTAGVRPGGIHELFMVAFSSQDETKMRYSNSVFLDVPADVCGLPALSPEVFSQPASGVTSEAAILRSQVRTNGFPTQAYFEWGETTGYGNQTTPTDIGDTLLYIQKPSILVNGLTCATDYHYRPVATNINGTTLGTDSAFTTGPCPDCGPENLILSNVAVNAQEAHEACNLITVGPSVSVEGTGDLRLIAPRVVFGDGFSVQSGGRLGVFPSPAALPLPTLQEDFEDGDITDWEFQIFGSNQHTASWGLVQDGSTVLELVGGTTSGGGDIIAHRTDFSGADYSVLAQLKVHEVRNGGHHSGLAMRVTNGLNFYELSVNRAQDLMRLLGWENGQHRDIASSALPADLLEDWITISFEAIGNNLRGYINGTLYIEATDDVHLNGNPGVVNSGSVTRFDDFRVEDR